MFTRAMIARELFLLALLLTLAGSSGAVVQAQDGGPGDPTGSKAGSLTAAPEHPLVSGEIAAVVPPPTAGLTYVSFNSIQFKPYVNTAQYAYDFGYGTLYLPAAGNTEFLAPVVLPNGAEIREITYWFRDDQVDVDLIIGLCRVPLGLSSISCIISQANTALTGNTGDLIARTTTGAPITKVDNASFSYFLVTSLSRSSIKYGLVAIRIGYGSSAYLPTIHH